MLKAPAVFTLLSLCLAAVASGCVVGRTRVVYVQRCAEPAIVRVTTVPPPPRVERRPVAPHPSHVWIGGHWDWSAGRWVWVGGGWQAPRPGHVWVPPRYDRDRYRPGFWGSTVTVEGARPRPRPPTPPHEDRGTTAETGEGGTVLHEPVDPGPRAPRTPGVVAEVRPAGNARCTGPSPASGVVGSTFTLDGSGFGSDPARVTVTVGDIGGAIRRLSDDSMLVEVPPGTAGGAITVRVGDVPATCGSFEVVRGRRPRDAHFPGRAQ